MGCASARAESDGWTWEVLRTASAEAGIDAPLVARLFPRGPADLVAAFHGEVDSAMERAVADGRIESLGYGERVGVAVRFRFRVLAARRGAVRRAMAFHALPANAGDSVRCLAQTADRIWRVVGDTSTDFSFYTRRATLGCVLAATTLVWLDDSVGAETEAFLARRLDDVRQFGRARARAEEVAADGLRRLAILRPRFPVGRLGAPGSRRAT